MASSSRAANCCSIEKSRLIRELEACNFCTDSYEAFHHCYRRAARKSGERSRNCILE